jgi:hypothetical protein
MQGGKHSKLVREPLERMRGWEEKEEKAMAMKRVVVVLQHEMIVTMRARDAEQGNDDDH